MNIDKFSRLDSGQYRTTTDVGTVELFRVRSDLWRMQSPYYSEDSRTMADALASFSEFMRLARSYKSMSQQENLLMDNLDKPEVVQALKSTKHPVARRASQGQTLWDYVQWVKATCPHRTDLIIGNARSVIAKALSVPEVTA